MATVTTNPCCVSCRREIPIVKCGSCLLAVESREERHELIQQVNDWECNSINEIRQIAEEARILIRKHTTDRMTQVTDKIMQISAQLQRAREENAFAPEKIGKWQEELIYMTRQLTAPINIKVHQAPSQIVTKILVDLPAIPVTPNIGANAKWIQNGTTVAGGNGQGNGLNQLYNPWGIYIDDGQTVYVADHSNHRVVEWKNGAATGKVVAGGNGSGNGANQLSSPTAVIVDKETDSLIIADYGNSRVVRWPRQNGTAGETIVSNVNCCGGLAIDGYGYLYVSDYSKRQVKRWKIGDTDGIVVAGGNGSGSRLDQLSNPLRIFVDQDHSVYVCDQSNHRVVKWVEGAKEGIIVAGGQGAGSGLTQLNSPWRIAVDLLGTVYVADHNNHRVVRWPKGAVQGIVIAGGNGQGAQQNQLNYCMHLTFDNKNNLYVCDNNNHRVQRFNIDPNSV